MSEPSPSAPSLSGLSVVGLVAPAHLDLDGHSPTCQLSPNWHQYLDFPTDPQGVSICENCGERGGTHTPALRRETQKPDATHGTRRVESRGLFEGLSPGRVVCVFTRLTGSLRAEGASWARGAAGYVAWFLAGPQHPHLSHSPVGAVDKDARTSDGNLQLHRGPWHL